MNDNYHAGRLVTLTLYMGAGFLSVGTCILKDLSWFTLGIVLFTWVFGFSVLLILNEYRGIKPSVYCNVFVTLLSFLGVGYCFTFDNQYLSLFGFFVECIACTLFLSLKAVNYMVASNIAILIFFCFIPKDHMIKYMAWSEKIATVAVYIVCAWIAAVLIRIVQNRNRINEEQAQSLDDLLHVVEAKCDDAQRANQAKSDFLAKMSHEIRTPINAILGLDTMILRESREAQAKSYAMDIQNEGQILLSLINDILDLSKIESGKIEINPVEYRLSTLLRDVHNMISFRAVEKDLNLEFIIDENLPSVLFGDDVRFRQIMVNILNNAVKYTEKGSVTLNISGEMDDNAVILRVRISDTGIGIKSEDMPRLFSKYERIENIKTRYVEGTGLGMSITLKLLELMDSSLKVESTYGVGSAFEFEIRQPVMDMTPIGKLQEKLQSTTVTYSYAPSFIQPDVKILVVDDNKSNLNVFISLLKETKVNIDTAEDGFACLERIKEKKYDIIFLDHMMPGIDGIETLKRLKADKSHMNMDTPVVALTANAVSGAREMYLSEGFDGFLSKPLRPERLEKLICQKLGIEAEEHKVEEQQSQTEIGRRLMEVDGVDWDYGMMNLGTEAIYIDTVKDFCKTYESERTVLETYLEEIEEDRQGLDDYRIKAHSMKTSAGMIGNLPLFGLAKTLENAAKDGRLDIISSLTPVFLENWCSFGEELKNIIPEMNQIEKKPVNSELVRSYMDMLHEAIQDMEIDTADEIILQLKGFDFNEEGLKLVKQLESAVSNLDEEQVVKLTGEIVEIL